ncbi:transient receptor potential cation channel subfamily A member 1 [Paragonimus westermani]|uniref:Transient receptor potential cation channel subfamily A member 1 n=1 Tax=Paragonimus westermani TaxID=34504 RepID=A0A5J4NFA1_9TREM|nr:transient receptor potential cation channel subfamily A member 1 [Paragonimus westermani]
MDQDVSISLLNAHQIEEKRMKRKNKHLVHPLHVMVESPSYSLIVVYNLISVGLRSRRFATTRFGHCDVGTKVAKIVRSTRSEYLLLSFTADSVYNFHACNQSTTNSDPMLWIFRLKLNTPQKLTELEEQNVSVNILCEKLKKHDLKTYKLHVVISKYGLMLLASLNLLKEFAQFWKYRMAYFNMENFIELTVYISAVLTTIDTSNCMRVTGLREHWQWQIGTIGLTLAWVNLLLYSQNSGRIGIYVGMYNQIMSNLTRLMLVFSPFIIAFVLAFHLLLANQYAYMSIESALTKVIVMISGELEFVQALFSRYQPNAGSDVHVRYVILTYVLFIVFIIVMAIALTNMLIGLAVGDVKEIQSQAIISKLRITIQTLFEAEDLLKTLRIRRDIPKMYTFFPNSKKALMDKAFNWLYTPRTKTEQFSVGKKKSRTTQNRLLELNQRMSRLQRRYDKIC